jgi:hypothetical protein
MFGKRARLRRAVQSGPIDIEGISAHPRFRLRLRHRIWLLKFRISKRLHRLSPRGDGFGDARD